MNFIKSYELAQNIIYNKLQIAEIQVLESCYFYSHFVRPNSILLSKSSPRLATYDSELMQSSVVSELSAFHCIMKKGANPIWTCPFFKVIKVCDVCLD